MNIFVWCLSRGVGLCVGGWWCIVFSCRWLVLVGVGWLVVLLVIACGLAVCGWVVGGCWWWVCCLVS